MEFEGRARIRSELNMAPMIDVVFLLLIFFMLTSTLIVQEGITVDLPSSTSSSVLELTPFKISIAKNGERFLNGEPVTLPVLRKRVRELAEAREKSARKVVVQSDAAVKVQDLIDTMDAVKEAGIADISLATNSGMDNT